MNDTVKAIVGILDTGRPELQVAASQILGELGLKDPLVVRSLQAAVGRSNVLGRFAIEALARIGTTDALRVVVHTLIEHEGLIDQAMHLLTESGMAAHQAIAEAVDSAPADRRLKLLTVLSRSLSREVVGPFVRALATPEVSAGAARLLHEVAAHSSEAVRKALREALVHAMKEPLPDASVASMIGVLAVADASGAKAMLMQHAGDKSPLPIRLAALAALRGQELTAVQAKAFLQLLEDPLHQPVHEAVRDVLTAQPVWPEGTEAQLQKLLASRQVEQRLFALKALRTHASAETVKIALKLRDHDDPRFRAAAEDVLATSKHAVEPLLRLLQLARDPVEAGRLSGLLVRQAPHIAPKTAKTIAERATKLLAQKPLVADHLADVALAAGGPKLVPFFLDRAIRWRKQKHFPEALHVLARLAQKDLLDGEGRYQLAVTRLLQDAVRPGAEGATPGNAAMGFFTVLLRDGFSLLDRVKKDATLAPEQQLKLASYFAQTVGAERRFGQELLLHLAQRHKGRTGEEAKLALRVAGA